MQQNSSRMQYVRDGANKDRITQNLRPASEVDPYGHRACTWDVSAAIDLSWREPVALPLPDAQSKTSETFRRPPDE
jgi:hypothetical protein